MIIYKITNLINGKIYIGKTSKSIEKRWNKHLNEATHHDHRHLYRAINKYGPQNFNINTVEICSQKEASSREMFWIKHYNSTNQNIGYNLTDGGENGHRSEEYRNRISQTLKAHFQKHGPPPNPTKGKFGVYHHFYGKHHNKKAKIALSIARKGKKYEDVMPEKTATRLRQLHTTLWRGNCNPSFKEIPIEKIVEFVHKYPLTTISDLSSTYSVSRPTIITKFKEYTGMTFNQYKKEKLGFNHGIYKILKNLGIDKSNWIKYNTAKQYELSCTYERSDHSKN